MIGQVSSLPSSGNDNTATTHSTSATITTPTTDISNSVDSTTGLRHRIFAGNLDFGTTKDQLYEAFSKCGKIVDEIRLHPGYAFIQFDSEDCCMKAISTLSGTQLCSKRIDVQMAKGPNNSQKKDGGTKRKLDNRDNNNNRDGRDRFRDNNKNNGRDNNNDRSSSRDNRGDSLKNKKQKRMDSPNRTINNNSNNHRSNSLIMPSSSSSTHIPTSSPYSNVPGVISVPIYIPDQTLENFANYVMQTLKSGGLMYHNVHIRNTNQGEYFFGTPQFYQLVANERFVISVSARHEVSRSTVSFKAIMPDGTCPGRLHQKFNN
jgi:RNA recognition motif-containing protein